MLLLTLFTAGLTAILAQDTTDVILKPIRQGSTVACLIMTQGADIEPSAYIPVMQVLKIRAPYYCCFFTDYMSVRFLC